MMMMCFVAEGDRTVEVAPMVPSVTTTPAYSSLQWTPFGTREYLFVLDEQRQLDLSRDAAAAQCSRGADGASLVTVDSEEVLEFLAAEIKRRVTAAGQQFAHEQWWTAGKARAGRWVWDVLGYPQGIVGFLLHVRRQSLRHSVGRRGVGYVGLVPSIIGPYIHRQDVRSTRRQYLNYSRGDFQVFRCAGRHVAPMGRNLT